MKFPCPLCGGQISLEQVEGAGDLVALEKVKAAFGEDYDLAREYLELFAAKRPLKLARRLRLFRDVFAILVKGGFEFQGAHYRVGRDEAREALRAACDQVIPPIANHNYLKRVLLGAARKTSQRQERALKDREQGAGAREQEAPLEAPVGTGQTVAWRQRYLELLKMSKDLKLTPKERGQAEAALQAHLEEGSNEEG